MLIFGEKELTFSFLIGSLLPDPVELCMSSTKSLDLREEGSDFALADIVGENVNCSSVPMFRVVLFDLLVWRFSKRSLTVVLREIMSGW